MGIDKAIDVTIGLIEENIKMQYQWTKQTSIELMDKLLKHHIDLEKIRNNKDTK